MPPSGLLSSIHLIDSQNNRFSKIQQDPQISIKVANQASAPETQFSHVYQSFSAGFRKGH
ncbi:MAG TPA: hypothetical protein DD706_09685 [Nitrospiraceae bacterium]|nr:hypothetical protein [Nitrospiraceae bacterium]